MLYIFSNFISESGWNFNFFIITNLEVGNSDNSTNACLKSNTTGKTLKNLKRINTFIWEIFDVRINGYNAFQNLIMLILFTFFFI